jgi:integrase
MGRKMSRLTAKDVEHAKRVGYFADGGGLYLQVSAMRGSHTRRTKSWIFRYTMGIRINTKGQEVPRQREMGLGPVHDVSLADARQRAAACRVLLLDGVDPIEHRDQRKRERALDVAKAVSFAICAERYIEAHRAGWSNAKHAAQWISTLDMYAGPVFGALPVATIDTGMVVKAIEPLWTKKHETATRLRARIEAVLDWAKVRGFRDGENPARWRGHLENILPTLARAKRVKHHPAMPHAELPAFMAKLKGMEGVAPLALEFLILTAARTGEVVGARFDEFDLKHEVWTVPAARMKSHRTHRVPLSARAVQVIKDMQAQRVKGQLYVFSGLREGTALSNAAMLAVLKRMDLPDVVVHGFRSTFRDWAAESTGHPREIIESALAHVVADATEAAYLRSDLFQKRVALMADWAMYCAGRKPGKVVSIKRKAGSK